MTASNDEMYMQEAIAEAKKASRKRDVPIGAVAVHNEKIVCRAHNVRERAHNPLGHAELILVEKLAKKWKNWRLEGVTVFVTCEPCLMCAGAMLQARIPKVVYGCSDPKAGAFGSLYDVSNDPRLNHRIEVVSGVLAKKCGELLSDFFEGIRKRR